MGKKGHGRLRARGFSTTELLVAILISTILASVGIGAYQIYQRDMPVRYAAEQLNRAVSTARSYAVTNNSYYTLRIDATYQNYWIDELDQYGTLAVPKVTTPEAIGEKAALVGAQYGDMLVTGPVSTLGVTFAPDGSCDDSRFWLRMGDGLMATHFMVRVYGPTGMSRVLSNVDGPSQTLTIVPREQR